MVFIPDPRAATLGPERERGRARGRSGSGARHMRTVTWIPQGLGSYRTPGTGRERQWSRDGGYGEVAPFPARLL